jgi:predicted permease
MIESTMLSSIGAALGIGLAWASSRFLVDVISTGPFQIVFDLTPNLHILGFSAAAGIGTAILFGFAPAIQIAHATPSRTLKDEGRTTAARARVLSLLIGTQVALSLLLLVDAGLFVRTLRNLEQLDPGFNREGVFVAGLENLRTGVPAGLLEDVRRIPGVRSASVSTHTPLSGARWTDIAVPQGQPLPERDTALFVGAGSRFFETMQTPLLAGREFADRDDPGAPGVVIVSESFARRYFPGRQPVGQYLSASIDGNRRDLEIVGLVADTKAIGLRRQPPAVVYVSYWQLTGRFPTSLEIRTNDSLAHLTPAIRDAVRSRLAGTDVEVHPLAAQVESTMVQERVMATLAGAFGGLALILACVGLYGLQAYSVARRTKELGIRLALGARRGRVIAMVLGSSLRLMAIGAAAGLPAAWIGSRAVQSMLFALRPTDLTTMVSAILLLVTAALAAAYVPAHRASRVDPLVALRHE